ncbi:relaxase/mobilization nuclease domain-containing protein [Thalassotalea agarivorans]|uniref:MobA/VirD2-like nuclease domain-containing protein n=1 Tax=Thalassotalea agarivorans TaxID=349064 RepID=A0A1I0GLG8_THASX|nr:relaxase/mobilization nuclease domain-containing protein [Thalassotalea agarivorans]SET71228.1 hypothetical protein SAMN05660429_02470 [Thalassotalea agarivorans]
MIIKSMSRKQPSFEQLYDYIVRDKDNDVKFNFTHNCFGVNREQILDEFMDNSSLLRRRKGGNYLYHEVLSVTRSKQLSEAQQKEILRDLAQQYLKSRANGCLAFGGMHDEKDNQLHYHFIISANQIGESKRYRLSKNEFDDAKVNAELYALERYPELEQEKLISNKDKKGKNSNKEAELKRRTKKPSQKDIMRDKLAEIFKESTSQTDYIKRLREANIESYIRGNAMGFINKDNGRRHRITTLGLSEEFDEMQYVFTHESEQKAKQKAEQKTEKDKKQKQEQSKSDHQSSNKEKKSQEKSKRQQTAEKRKAEFKSRTANRKNTDGGSGGRGRKK